jgi:DNA-binding NarL/FixJ family response regulator
VAEGLVLSERAVEKHINSIFAKLNLPEGRSAHRRVKAVLLFLAEQS